MFTNSHQTAIITLENIASSVEIKSKPMNINTNNLGFIFAKAVTTVLNTAEKPINNQINASVSQQRQFVQISQSSQTLTFNTINDAQLKALINNLLDIPNDLKTFLAMFTDNTNVSNLSEKELINILSNSLINIEAMNVLLSNNASNIINKLLKLMSGNMGMQNIEQFKEITALLSACTPSSSNASKEETLKNIILLYLPWLPLDADIKFSIEQRKKKAEASSEEQNYVVIKMETKTFGNIRIVIILDGNNLVFKIEARDDFPKDSISKLIHNEFTKFSLNTQVNCTAKKSVPKAESKRNVELSTTGQINPILLLAAHSIIKIIIEADKCSFGS